MQCKLALNIDNECLLMMSQELWQVYVHSMNQGKGLYIKNIFGE